jgi:hypothetical protein
MIRVTREQTAQSRIVMAEVDPLPARCNVWVEHRYAMTEKPNVPTADLCQAKARECLYLAQNAGSKSHRIMLEHIAETWYRIADSLPANDA